MEEKSLIPSLNRDLLTVPAISASVAADVAATIDKTECCYA